MVRYWKRCVVEEPASLLVGTFFDCWGGTDRPYCVFLHGGKLEKSVACRMLFAFYFSYSFANIHIRYIINRLCYCNPCSISTDWALCWILWVMLSPRLTYSSTEDLHEHSLLTGIRLLNTGRLGALRDLRLWTCYQLSYPSLAGGAGATGSVDWGLRLCFCSVWCRLCPLLGSIGKVGRN